MAILTFEINIIKIYYYIIISGPILQRDRRVIQVVCSQSLLSDYFVPMELVLDMHTYVLDVKTSLLYT